ncbi:IS21 family transposase [Tautonia plasticadhaerens]|uniref:Integrase core domain protein n=1 Tax=Tautonia plasticadhaerens TaxID=2527974 RepID=A0A518H5U2_9BACT|nr:IS21 family transposase [Tautonia plasticadhaerens]QDV36197.1 Integrase core domain protein [Tautonia plasticadhaerens]
MFTDMENWAEIRRRVLVDGLGKRAACRQYDIHWDTLQKILRHPEPPGYRRASPRPRPKLDPFLGVLHQILQDDKKAPRKQRHTAKRLFERLRDEHGYTGGLTGIKDAVRAWRRSHTEVFVPLTHPPGEAQVDFGEAEVTLDGRPTKVAVFVLTLPYSDAIYCRAFPRECTEAFLEGHVRAFSALGGVPRRISYDNSKIAVARITGSRDRRVTGEFLRLKSHYLFESHFCLVRRPNEKGHVETLVGFARRNFLVLIPVLHDGLEGLNARLEADCRSDLTRRLRGKPASKAELLAEERAAMLPQPAEAFVAARVEQPFADSLSLVRFDANDYSVPTQLAYRQVTAIGTVDLVRIVVGDRVVATHRRSWGREGVFYEPVHYLALLERKPGAFDFAAPLAGWELPVCFGVLRRRLEAEFGGPGTRQFIKVLRLLEHASLRELTRAVEAALELGTADADAVRLILEHRRERPVGLFCLDGRPHLKLVSVPVPDLDAYRRLTAEVRP